MNYIVLDLEWNQPFYMKKMIKKPVFLHGEIIQIGAVKTDENHLILDTFKIMVTPKYYTKMHKKVSQLTKITTEDLKYGFPFPAALRHFREWCGDEFAFLTWGADDIQMLRENMALYQLETEWIPSAYNLQIIFDAQITKENRQISLSAAMEKTGEVSLDAHDALNDAKNTTRVCRHLDMVKGLSEYGLYQKKMKRYDDHVVERSANGKSYASKEEALNDPELICFVCSSRGGKVSCGDFVKQNSEKYICIGQCENGEELFVRFKFKKCPDGNYSVSRIVYEVNEENRNYYRERKLDIEKARAAYLQRMAEAV